MEGGNKMEVMTVCVIMHNVKDEHDERIYDK
jgi:hypothetical protein